MITRTIGSESGNHFFPALLIDALKSDRPEVVKAAINWTPHCWDKSRYAEVGRLLISIFEGDNEPLKFQACFPLMHSYGYGKAAEYLLTQTQSKDRQRTRRAISWLGDSCNHQKPAFPRLLKSLVPFLNSDDKEIRRIAADALATYAGEDVVKNLIPLLADEQQIIVTEVSYKLLRQRDTVMLRRLLSSAAANSVDDNVRRRAAEPLGRLDQSR